MKYRGAQWARNFRARARSYGFSVVIQQAKYYHMDDWYRVSISGNGIRKNNLSIRQADDLLNDYIEKYKKEKREKNAPQV